MHVCDYTRVDVPDRDWHAMGMTEHEPDLTVVANAVTAARVRKGLSKEEAARLAGISSITWKRVEDGLRVQDAKLSAVMQTLGLAQSPAPQFPQLPQLPRDAPNAPILSSMDAALGIHPIRPGVSQNMTPAERQLMVKVRNKLYKDVGDFDSDELVALTKFVEDEELRSLHARLDWLPRSEQLEVSELITELERRVDQRLVDMGVTNETAYEDLPAGAPRPNPLPREGILPDTQDFPSQVPTYQQTKTEGETHDTDQQESRTGTSSEVDSSAGGGTESSEPPIGAATAATEDGKPDALIPPGQGQQDDYTLAARKGETEYHIRQRTEPQSEDENQDTGSDEGA